MQAPTPDPTGGALSREERDQKLTEAIGRLTIREVIEFFEARGARPTCPFCGKNSWAVNDPTTEGVFANALHKPKEIGSVVVGGVVVPQVAVTCTNCAFVRTHAAVPIAAWLLEKESKSG